MLRYPRSPSSRRRGCCAGGSSPSRLPASASRSGRSTAAFLAGALAGGMTLRPEPVTAFFVVAVLACVVRFRERESTGAARARAGARPSRGPRPSGGRRDAGPAARRRAARSSAGHGGTSVRRGPWSPRGRALRGPRFVGADLEQRRADARGRARTGRMPTGGTSSSATRWLQDYAYGTPLRRMVVALIGLAVLAFFLRRRRNGLVLLDLPGGLARPDAHPPVATPSRHPFQFGALLGLAAVAVTAETVRLRERARLERLEREAVPRARSGDACRRLGMVAAARLEPARPADARVDARDRGLAPAPVARDRACRSFFSRERC